MIGRVAAATAAAALAAAGAGPAAAQDERLACIGTEPFWNLEVDGGRASFQTMEGERLELAITSHGTTENHTNRWVWRAKILGRGPPAAFVVTRTACSDGMSDRVHAYDLVLILPDRALSGCCNPSG